ncbi:hypothetical protein GCM10027074_72990 [Streptomyces deserti]
MTVRHLVRQGRYAARGPLGMLREGDDPVGRRALRDVGVEQWAERDVDALSGGERQRVRLAMALAQDTRVLLLDEPTTYLDLHHQLDVLQTVVRLREERGLTVVMVLHDLAHAARFAERIVALREGRVVADGRSSRPGCWRMSSRWRGGSAGTPRAVGRCVTRITLSQV